MPSRIILALGLAFTVACGGDGQDLPYVPPQPIAIGLSAGGPDQLHSAAVGPNDSFYLAGFRAEAVETTSPRTVVVVKLLHTGQLDTTFGGGDGIADTTLDFRGGNDEIDIVVQPSGKIVVSATIANQTVALDRDMAMTRLNADGSVDSGFGSGGVARFDLGTALVSGSTATGTDAARGLAVDGEGRLYLHGGTRGEGTWNGAPRTDLDFVLIRTSVDGTLDTGFATGGKHIVDIRANDAMGTPSSATARGVHIFANGEIIAAGYSTTAGIATGPQPVLYKLDSSGAKITTFSTGGLFHEAVLSIQTEVYNVAVHGNEFVTAGYGRDTGDQNDWVSLRFGIDGTRDLAWGGTTNGVVQLDPTGTRVGDNCRNAIALPDGRTLLVGSTGPGNMPAQDAVFAVLDGDGHLDTNFGTGMTHFPFDGDGGNDQLWGGAASDDYAVMVGYRGGLAANTQTAGFNDDSYALILPLR
jgi:uncharacterized delta-60 repeat protein